MRHLILYHTAHSLSNYFAQIFLVSSGFSACRRRGLPRPIAVPRPSPRDPLHPKFHLAFGVAESPQGDSLYASPAGPYFCSCKSRQNTLGAVPQDPLAAKLRLDTDWAFQLPLKSRSAQRRRYALKVPAAHFILAPSRDRIKINTL